jgi:hypothetical protein
MKKGTGGRLNLGKLANPGKIRLGLCMAILRKMRLLPKITFCQAAVAPMNGS